VKLNKEYIIAFEGLKLGVHNFEYNITDEFFEIFEYAIVQKGNIRVDLALEKKETMLIGHYNISGNIEKECDRCNDPVTVEIDASYRLIYKFDTVSSNDESLIVIYPDQHEIDVKENILELITVSLPARAIHDEDQCNDEMRSILDEYVLRSEEEIEQSLPDDEEIDPRWQALKELENKKRK
jgi:uncharacterized metal-binding protein YceD (DUF177 family)